MEKMYSRRTKSISVKCDTKSVDLHNAFKLYKVHVFQYI
jgi:hypothetical protein